MRKSLMLPLLLAALTMATVASQPADGASCPQMIEYVYFYDAAHTQYAGDCTKTCSGNTYCTGVRTIYYYTHVEGTCYNHCW